MTDIVERLRAVIPFEGKQKVAFMCHEAADHIEALEAQLAARDAEIAAWLRTQGLGWRTRGDYANAYDLIAAGIEAGAYRRTTDD